MNEVNSTAKTAIETVSILQEHFPVAFPDQKSKSLLPLKKRIDKDIKDELDKKGVEISRKSIRSGLARWCRHLNYFRSVIRETNRIDLHGNHVEAVSEEEKQFAKKQMEIVKNKLNGKREDQKKLSTKKVK